MKSNISFERIHEVLDYNLKTGIFVWKVQQGSRALKGAVAGTLKHGYILIQIDGKAYQAHRLAWLYVYGYFPEYELDHRDRIKHHNWISNLREASNSCNIKNTGNRADNTSGIKGVSWDKSNNKWEVRIRINNKYCYGGQYKDFTEAVCTRLAMEQCINYETCDSNSPAYQYVKTHVQNRG
jgi:hypothetical protein